MKTVGQRIEELLLQKNNGNQSELARYVGVSPQAVQKWIAGFTEPKGKNLLKVAEFVGASPSQIKFGGADAIITYGDGTAAIIQAKETKPAEQINPVADQKFKFSEDIQAVIRIMEDTDEDGRKEILLKAKLISEQRMIHISELSKVKHQYSPEVAKTLAATGLLSTAQTRKIKEPK